MNLRIEPGSSLPIYEQLKIQIKEKILSGKLKPGNQLPSMRVLSKDLRLGMVTVKRAYDDLAAEGYLYTMPGKGVYVSKLDLEDIREHYVGEIGSSLDDIKLLARAAGIEKRELLELIKDYLREDE